ncbi:MAG: hypothetical protein J6W84_01670 [Bacteroidales bacterium]|nr:hypothetical protein [Bacteroidales bacterium]
MYTYRYLCTHRPPGIGAIPNGAVNVEFFDAYIGDAGGHGRYVFGAAEYDRELTLKEMCDYELEYDSEGEV